MRVLISPVRTRLSRRRATLRALGVLVLLGGALTQRATGIAAAQAGPSAAVLEARHDPAGRIVVEIATADAALASSGVTALVDGVPRTAKALAASAPGRATLEVSVPPLALGHHDVSLRLGRAGTPLTLSSGVEVVNEGLLRLSVGAPAEPTAAVDVRAELAGPTAGLDVRFFLDGAPIGLVAPARASVDPWRQTPGTKRLEGRATTEGRLVAAAEATLTVPPLDPLLAIEHAPGSEVDVLTIRGNVQGADAPSMVVRDGEQLLLRTLEPLARLTVPANRTITVELRAGDRSVRTELVATKANAAPTQSALHLPSPAVLLTMAGLLAALAVLLARRQARFRNGAVLAALAPNRPAPAPLHEYAPVQLLPVSLSQLPRLVIRGPHGVVRRVPVPTDSAVTIGSSGSCDIHLDDDSLRPVHGRLTPFADGHFVLQAIGADGDAGEVSSEMLIVRPRDEVRVGSYVLVIE